MDVIAKAAITDNVVDLMSRKLQRLSPRTQRAVTLAACAVLKQTGGVSEGPKGAAKILNLHPNTLRSRMKELGIKYSDHEIS